MTVLTTTSHVLLARAHELCNRSPWCVQHHQSFSPSPCASFQDDEIACLSDSRDGHRCQPVNLPPGARHVTWYAYQVDRSELLLGTVGPCTTLQCMHGDRKLILQSRTRSWLYERNFRKVYLTNNTTFNDGKLSVFLFRRLRHSRVL